MPAGSTLENLIGACASRIGVWEYNIDFQYSKEPQGILLVFLEAFILLRLEFKPAMKKLPFIIKAVALNKHLGQRPLSF